MTHGRVRAEEQAGIFSAVVRFGHMSPAVTFMGAFTRAGAQTHSDRVSE